MRSHFCFPKITLKRILAIWWWCIYARDCLFVMWKILKGIFEFFISLFFVSLDRCSLLGWCFGCNKFKWNVASDRDRVRQSCQTVLASRTLKGAFLSNLHAMIFTLDLINEGLFVIFFLDVGCWPWNFDFNAFVNFLNFSLCQPPLELLINNFPTISCLLIEKIVISNATKNNQIFSQSRKALTISINSKYLCCTIFIIHKT